MIQLPWLAQLVGLHSSAGLWTRLKVVHGPAEMFRMGMSRKFTGVSSVLAQIVRASQLPPWEICH